jgi:hypothetical protein
MDHLPKSRMASDQGVILWEWGCRWGRKLQKPVLKAADQNVHQHGICIDAVRKLDWLSGGELNTTSEAEDVVEIVNWARTRWT